MGESSLMLAWDVAGQKEVKVKANPDGTLPVSSTPAGGTQDVQEVGAQGTNVAKLAAITPVAADVGHGKADVPQSTTDQVLVAAQGAGKIIRVLAAREQCGATATNFQYNTKGAGAGVAISAVHQNGANGGSVLPYNPTGWFKTAANEALTGSSAAGSQTGVEFIYDVIDE